MTARAKRIAHLGDFTWRYRLWEWLRPLGDGTIFEDVDFVGPWTGTYPPVKPETAEPKPPPLMGDNPVGNSDSGPITNQGGAYNKGVNSDFPDRHLARWGLQAAQVKSQVFTAVERYSPSYLLLMIGFNDIGWFVSDADGLLKTLGEIVKGAQAVNPNLQILVANIVHRTAIGGREDLVEKTTSVNTRLPGWADEWSTDSSSVKLVDIASVYKCGTGGCPDGYDGLHPNAEGEYHIASEFSNVLVKDFAIGSDRLKVPASIPVRTASVPSNFKVTAAPSGMVASWDHVFGAFGYEIRTAIGDQDWSEPIRISTNAYYYSWVRKNASVRTVMGDDIKSSWTSTQSATANPQTPRPPRNVTTSPAGSSMVVRWNPSLDSVERYGVIYYDQTDKGFAQSVGTHANYLNIDGLKIGHLYTVAVQSWNSNGGGLPQPARGVIPGSGRPLTPRLLSVKSIDNYELQLKWAADVVYTVGYRVWIRNTKDGKPATTDEYGTTTDLTYSIFFMFSPWDYEFCVTAYNGDVESPKSNCMIPEKL
ncbi:SGNH hydrolase-type esterase domain-containing protein [Boeremia exigua]|uniref:SGNH hydrolase-type esterase domain-containing protein n=1 Tax=Boeremia exigua TaxID=749465 RepID=UPI001E8D921D|nr:SGNH hydrolase-type esterase domain-containing protein [Boeremia exigua]KAH6638475.1 SGNH hydrolase-type esterase domain-containing protein [Boeremia exigua]